MWGDSRFPGTIVEESWVHQAYSWSHPMASLFPRYPKCLSMKAESFAMGSYSSGSSSDCFLLPQNSETISDLKTLHVFSCLQPCANSVISFCHNYWFIGLSLPQDSELVGAKDCVTHFCMQIQICSLCAKCFRNVLFKNKLMNEWVSEWMKVWGSKAKPNDVFEDPKNINFLDRNWTRTLNSSPNLTLFLSIPSLPRVRCLGLENKGRKCGDVCLQGYMCGLILEDVFQQILRP